MEVSVALVVLIFSSVAYFFISWAFRRHNHHQIFARNGIPGPRPHFLFGNLLDFKRDINYNGLFAEWINKYGDVFGFFMGETPHVVVKDLDLLKQIFIKDFNLFVNRPDMYVSANIFPHSVIGAKAPRWKEIRTVLSPMYSSGKLKLLTEMVLKKVALTVSLIEEKSQNSEMFNIYEFMQGLTMDTIASAALGLKVDSQENRENALLSAVNNFFKFQHNIIIDVALVFPSLAKKIDRVSKYTEFGKVRDFIIDNLQRIIKERSKNDLRGPDILQALIDKSELSKEDNSGTKLTKLEVVSNAFGIFVAGYETTSTALAYTFYLLAKHPDIQQRLFEEIKAAKDSSYDTVLNLRYLDQVFNEALRFYPPVTLFVSRNSSKDYQLGPYTIPKGCEVLAPVWNIHHDPNLFPDPSKFDPDRFQDRDSTKNIAFMPFGIGPRNCLGARFALLESKLLLFNVLKRMKIEVCEKTEDPLRTVCYSVLQMPLNGVWVKATKRTE